MAKEYNGHASRNQWNVALYIGNEYDLYKTAEDCAKRARNAEHCTTLFLRETGLLNQATPDGYVYNRLSVKRAIEGLELEYGAAR